MCLSAIIRWCRSKLGKSVIYTLNGQTQGSESKTFISQELKFRN
nr:MAG TPA: hypothetical protein [Caudoviricetes sp.]